MEHYLFKSPRGGTHQCKCLLASSGQTASVYRMSRKMSYMYMLTYGLGTSVHLYMACDPSTLTFNFSLGRLGHNRMVSQGSEEKGLCFKGIM